MSTSLLLVPSFEVPDAFVELAERIDGAATFEWPPASSADLADQEVMAGPVLRGLLSPTGRQGPKTLVVLENAASAVLSAIGTAPVRTLLIDPRPYLWVDPPTREEGLQALGKVMAEVPEPSKDFLGTADGGDPEEALEGVLEWMEHDVIPSIEDPHERRRTTATLQVLRRDGPGPPSVGPGVRSVPDWSDVLGRDGLGSRPTVWLTPSMNRAGSLREAILSRGAADVEEVDLPMAWWWAAPERAAALISEFWRRQH